MYIYLITLFSKNNRVLETFEIENEEPLLIGSNLKKYWLRFARIFINNQAETITITDKKNNTKN